jgi:hypothetical protein
VRDDVDLMLVTEDARGTNEKASAKRLER